MKDLVILGASGHGKVVADTACCMKKYNRIIFLDNDREKKECMGFPVEGVFLDYGKYMETAEFIVATGNSNIREIWTERLKRSGAKLAILIHPSATVSRFAKIESGTIVMAGAVVNAETKIGQGVIVNTCASVDHDCEIGDYCHISVGAHLAGTVSVGKHTWIGIGAVVRNNLSICENCMIGAGAVVVKKIMKSGTYVGVPAKRCENIAVNK